MFFWVCLSLLLSVFENCLILFVIYFAILVIRLYKDNFDYCKLIFICDNFIS